jgi:transcription antitermination factor NusG
LAVEVINNEAQAALPWYAIHVKSKQEHLVSAGLHGRGYEAFLPLYRSQRSWSDRQKQLDLPLFPGYVFCRLNVDRRQPIVSVPGVVSILGLGRTPMPVPEEEVAAVQRLVRSGLMAVPWPFLRTGERVLIERGPLVGLEGTLLEIKSGLRLVLSIELLQRSVAAEVDRAWIRPVPKSLPPTATEHNSGSQFRY